MNTPFRRYLLLGALAIFVGATPTRAVSVVTDFVKGAPFEKYRTYAIVLGETQLKETGKAALLSSIRENMARRGFKETKKANADLAIVPIVLVGEKVERVPTISNVQVYTPGRTYRAGTWSTATDMRITPEGTLALDFVDQKWRKELVFRGVAKGGIRDAATNARNIRDAVGKIVRAFPKSPRS